MAEIDHLPNDERVIQVGLYSDSIQEIENFVKRVSRFNDRFATSVLLDIQPQQNSDRADIRLTFPNHQVQEKFWLE